MTEWKNRLVDRALKRRHVERNTFMGCEIITWQCVKCRTLKHHDAFPTNVNTLMPQSTCLECKGFRSRRAYYNHLKGARRS